VLVDAVDGNFICPSDGRQFGLYIMDSGDTERERERERERGMGGAE